MTLPRAPLIPTPEDAWQQANLEDRLASVQKVLGEGVHPRAVERLVQLWPDAVVTIKHTEGLRDGVFSKVTRCWIRASREVEMTEGDPTLIARGEARCRLDHDRFDRRTGRVLAFHRAFRKVPR